MMAEPQETAERATPAAPAVRGRRLSRILTVVCAVLVVATGVSAVAVFLNLNSWHQTIADQQAKIESLEATEEGQSPKLQDLRAQQAKAVGVRRDLDQVEFEATSCRAAVSAWREASLATAADALGGVFVQCGVHL
jgi:hypothetical protein